MIEKYLWYIIIIKNYKYFEILHKNLKKYK